MRYLVDEAEPGVSVRDAGGGGEVGDCFEIFRAWLDFRSRDPLVLGKVELARVQGYAVVSTDFEPLCCLMVSSGYESRACLYI